jgi:hypothetical protein
VTKIITVILQAFKNINEKHYYKQKIENVDIGFITASCENPLQSR